MDEKKYFQPDFNPASLKVAELRKVLMLNDVEYSGAAKKSELVKLFNKHVKPVAAKKLAELEGVVPNDDGILVVEKKRGKKSSSRKTSKNEKPAVDDEPEQEEEKNTRSPRKVSKSKKPKKLDVEVNSDSDTDHNDSDIEDVTQQQVRKTSRSRNLGAIPDLKQQLTDAASERRTSPLRDRSPLRNRSPARASSTREKSPYRVEKPSRDRSPKRVSSKKTTREREKSPARKVSGPKAKKEKLKEEKIDSPFKFEKKPETLFSNDNVFQSSSPVSASKLIPKKRSNDENSKKSPKKLSTIQKTAFSSSPDEKPLSKRKSPVKKSLEISKFEDSSSPSSGFTSKNHLDIFNETPKKAVKTEPESHAEFLTPGETQTANNSVVITKQEYENTPSIKSSPPPPQTQRRRTLLPSFLQSLGIKTQGELKVEQQVEEKKEEEHDDELIEEDSDILNLQKEIESTNNVVLAETEDAIKKVNNIFNDGQQSSDEDELDINQFIRDPEEDTPVAEEVPPAEAQEHEQEETKDAEEIKDTEEVKSTSTFSFKSILSTFFSFLSNVLIFTAFVAIVSFALWYREQRVLIGYCGSEIYQDTFPNTDNEYLIKFDQFLNELKPACLECPENAICLPNLEIKCKDDHIVHKPWYKLYDILPFSDYCVFDDEKEKIINEIVSKTLELLRIKNAQVKCGSCGDDEIELVGLSADELYEFFYTSKSSISDEEFNELWEKVIETIENEPEITVRQVYQVINPAAMSAIILTLTQVGYSTLDHPGITKDNLSTNETETQKTVPKQKLFRSTSFLKLSLKCKFEREIYDNFKKFKKEIIIVNFMCVIGLMVYYKIKSIKMKNLKVQEISDLIVSRLKKQKELATKDINGLTHRYLSNIQLRDEYLHNLNNSKKKFEFWELVLNNLEKNSNIRSPTQEIHGEIVKVLEWIGE